MQVQIGNKDFAPVILGTGLNAYNIARNLHQRYAIASLALGRVALRETANSSIIEVRADRNFDDPDVVIESLLNLPDELGDRPILLISTVELYTTILLEHRHRLPPQFRMALVPAQTAELLVNKTDFYQTCEKLGIPHPTTRVLRPAMLPELTEAGEFGANLGFDYPVILKPSNTDTYPRISFAGKQKVYLIANFAELRDVATRIFAAGYHDDLIIQYYIPGDETVMRVANTYSNHDGKMTFLSMGQVVLADHDPKMVGNNNAIISAYDADLTEHLRHLLDAVGYHGLANFDIMYDRRDDTNKVLEVNLRPGATSYYTTVAGGDLINHLVQDLIYGNCEPDTITKKTGLWLNVPYLVALRYAPKKLRDRVRKVSREDRGHTLWYRPDLSFKRLITVVKIDLRYTRSTMKYAGKGLNH